MKISSKTEFFNLWEKGVLGNRTRLWRDPKDAYRWGLAQSRAQKSGRSKPEIGFRQIGKSGGGKWEKVGWGDVFRTAMVWGDEGRKYILDDGAPDDCRTLQGEVCRTYRGLEGYLDTVGQLPMRPAMAAGHMRHCSGSVVLALLERFMDPSSQDDLRDLLDVYPDATIEFSCFGRDVGVFPGRNTIFWETRNF